MDKEFNLSKIEYGDAGVLFIPDCDIQRPLYSKIRKASNGQDIVDAENSAYYQVFKDYANIIGDHASQGFNKIKSLPIYTWAFIQTKKDTQAYYCIGELLGTRRKDDRIYLPNGQRVTRIKWADLLCCTCNNDDSTQETIVLFKKSFHLDYPMYKEA